MSPTVTAGEPFTLGVVPDGTGVNVALSARNATKVELCLFDDALTESRVEIPYSSNGVWHAHVSDINPGQRYGFRVYGPYEPSEGLRFNPHKVLVDPYARAVEGSVNWDLPVFGYRPGSTDLDMTFDHRDSSAGTPRSIVVDPAFDWGADRLLEIPWNETIIYETHVKGFTARHPDIPLELRGTYSGLAHPAAINHLQRLGITAVELLPIHDFVDELHLVQHGLRNYWGYNTLAYFAPTARYSSRADPGGQVAEFKAMVKSLHAAGLEVLLDVVYNHTAEGNEFGPTISFRGIDNAGYYHLSPNRARHYVDHTGTGNSVNVSHPQTLKLIMDSLRYWVLEMHVDGFRFDLAVTLARDRHEFDRQAAFFSAIHQDPVLSRVKLIAEPWDVGQGGYQVGKFPILWAEWNAEYRDTVRRYWRGDESHVDNLAFRLTGSSDLYAQDSRGPLASINFVTAHDGFTLHDLVSYNEKHNAANGEGNRDGADHNISSNFGVEGPTTDPEIVELRERQKRNFLATLLFSQGVPMLLGGDEIGRTQLGNNNAYCQDNEISWYDWNIDDSQRDMLEFVSRVIAIRMRHPNLRRQQFFTGSPVGGSTRNDITWLRPDGNEMSADDWYTSWVRSLGAILDGSGIAGLAANGRPIRDDSLLVMLNADHGPVRFTIPSNGPPNWELLIDTASPLREDSRLYSAGADIQLHDRSMLLLREHRIISGTSC